MWIRKMSTGGIEPTTNLKKAVVDDRSTTHTQTLDWCHKRGDVTGALFQIFTLFSAYLLPRKTEDCRPNRAKNGRLHFGELL